MSDAEFTCPACGKKVAVIRSGSHMLRHGVDWERTRARTAHDLRNVWMAPCGRRCGTQLDAARHLEEHGLTCLIEHFLL